MTSFIKPLAACAAFLPLSTLASPAWTTCESLSGTPGLELLDGRLACATMTVPVDHDHPEAGEMQVGLIRIGAAIKGSRLGSIFFDFGGPGIDPSEFLARTAAYWSAASPNDPDDGDKRRLSDAYDLVAVVPRGLRAGTAVTCSPISLSPPESFAERDDDAHWSRAVAWAAAYATACADVPLAPYINTYQHAKDIEQARRWMGEPALHFVGSSYGARVGFTYASLYPEYIGRFVFDSAIGLFDSFAEANARSRRELDYAVLRDAIAPALTAPTIWQLGSDRQILEGRLKRLDPALRATWLPHMISPASLVAALHLAQRIQDAGDQDLRNWITSQRFHEEAGTHIAIAKEAHRLLDVYEDTSSTPDDPDGDAVNLMTLCNDGGWNESLSGWRDLAARHRDTHLVWTGHDIAQGLVCSQWNVTPRPVTWKPSGAPRWPVLMVHAQHDVATPLTSAWHNADAMPRARLVVAQGMRGHIVHGRSRTPCIERAIGRYLLKGELPEAKHSSCEFVAREVSP